MISTAFKQSLPRVQMVGISEDDKPFIYHMWLAGNLVYLSLPCPHLVPKHQSLGSNTKWCSVHTLCVSDMYLFVVVTWIQVTPGYWHKMVLCPHTGHLILHVFRHQFLSEVVVSYGCAMKWIASKLTRNASTQGFVLCLGGSYRPCSELLGWYLKKEGVHISAQRVS